MTKREKRRNNNIASWNLAGPGSQGCIRIPNLYTDGKCHGASFACKKFSEKQTIWIVAQTMPSFNAPKMLGALRAPSIVLKQDEAKKKAKAIGGESIWIAIEVIINNPPKIIVSSHLPHKRLPLEQFTATLEE